MRRRRRLLRTAALALALAPATGATFQGAKDSKAQPGAYCPLPEGDEPPACLQPATRDYARFFEGLAAGELDEAAVAEVEQDLEGEPGEQRYEALSSLVYAYYTLSRAAAASSETDSAVAERLERWNAVLGETYRDSRGDERFRGALKTAAGDLQENAPAVRIRCRDSQGNLVGCDSTDAVASAMTDARDETGLRGAVARLLQRLWGGD